MNFTCILFGILFVVVGLLFAIGKLHIHLSSWKKMADEEKEKIHIKSLCLNIGVVIMLNGLIFMLKGLFAGFTTNCFTIAIVIWMIIAGIDVRYISKSNKYTVGE